jgi:hypothetical protein
MLHRGGDLNAGELALRPQSKSEFTRFDRAWKEKRSRSDKHIFVWKSMMKLRKCSLDSRMVKEHCRIKITVFRDVIIFYLII